MQERAAVFRGTLIHVLNTEDDCYRAICDLDSGTLIHVLNTEDDRQQGGTYHIHQTLIHVLNTEDDKDNEVITGKDQYFNPRPQHRGRPWKREMVFPAMTL